MKTLFLGCILFSLAMYAAEYELKNGTKIEATFVKHQRGSVLLQRDDGTTKDFPESSFKWSSLARMLPSNNVYDVCFNYAYELEELKTKNNQRVEAANKTLFVMQNYVELSKRYDDVITVLSRYEKDGKLPSYIAKDIEKITNTKLKVSESEPKIPDEIYDNIRLSAKRMWPGENDKQISWIMKEEAAYKKINFKKE
jgi:hypothetical protein